MAYGFYRYRGICKMKVHKKSINKMKDKIRVLTRRSNGWSNEKRTEKINQFVRGWVNYFSMADMKKLMLETLCVIIDVSEVKKNLWYNRNTYNH